MVLPVPWRFFYWSSTEMKFSTERVSLGYTCKSVNNAVKQTHRAKPNEKAESQAAGDMGSFDKEELKVV